MPTGFMYLTGRIITTRETGTMATIAGRKEHIVTEEITMVEEIIVGEMMAVTEEAVVMEGAAVTEEVVVTEGITTREVMMAARDNTANTGITASGSMETAVAMVTATEAMVTATVGMETAMATVAATEEGDKKKFTYCRDYFIPRSK